MGRVQGVTAVVIDEATAIARLRAAAVPPPIVDVARTLHAAGHEAVLVGGAVRDVLLDLPASDWDLASSATPQEVMDLFARTIPTGVQHGTVTVMVRDGDIDHPVEITTYRGEGAYVDGRRPQEVVFLRDLVEDLARRDFTVNALAWDPVAERFSDPFGGREDLAAGVVRAVGDPVQRFTEDGLRTMRAVRFCATRQLSLDAATEAAIPQALDVLAKVSGERVRVELVKLLASAEPSRGLRPMWRTGIWAQVLLPLLEPADYEQAIAAVDEMQAEPIARLARLLWPRVGDDPASARASIEACVESLRPSKAERAQVLALTGPGAVALARAGTDPEIRRAVAVLGRGNVAAAVDMLGLPKPRRAQVEAAIEGVALRPSELSIKGRDLIAQGVLSPGPALGRTLAALLDLVLDDPTLDKPEILVERARALAP